MPAGSSAVTFATGPTELERAAQTIKAGREARAASRDARERRRKAAEVALRGRDALMAASALDAGIAKAIRQTSLTDGGGGGRPHMLDF
jgi:hypothetical protein